MAATISELLDTIQDNSDYAESDSLTKARAYESALLQYMLLLPSAQSDQGSSMAYDMATARMLLDRVTAFITSYQAAAQSSADTSRVRFLNCREGFYR